MKTHFPYSQHLLKVFGGKTYKIVIRSGMTCPTRDGRISRTGCAFCDVRGSSSYYGLQGATSHSSPDLHPGCPPPSPEYFEQLRIQIEKKIPALEQRFNATRFLAYFQSYSNTYADLPILETLYSTVLNIPEISGLCIATRPDCLPNEILELIETFAQKKYVSIELGVQSFEAATLQWLDRGHTVSCTEDTLQRCHRLAPHANLCAHLIFGCPTDSPDSAIQSALKLNSLQVHGAKLHQLMILKNSILESRWKKEPFSTLSMEAYAHCVKQFIEHLSPEIYIERLCATASHNEECIAPQWSTHRWTPHNKIREYLEINSCRQGSAL